MRGLTCWLFPLIRKWKNFLQIYFCCWEMVHWLRARAILAENTGSVLSTNMALKTLLDFSSNKSNAPSDLPGTRHTVHTYMHASKISMHIKWNIYIHIYFHICIYTYIWKKFVTTRVSWLPFKYPLELLTAPFMLIHYLNVRNVYLFLLIEYWHRPWQSYYTFINPKNNIKSLVLASLIFTY